MHIISFGDDLQKMLRPVFWGNKKNPITLSSAELAHLVKVKNIQLLELRSRTRVTNAKSHPPCRCPDRIEKQNNERSNQTRQ